jgi:hypothetical protein
MCLTELQIHFLLKIYVLRRLVRMKKNRILGIAIAAIIGVSSMIPAFAEDSTSQSQTANTAQVQTKKLTQEEVLQKLTKKATKLGVDITGLTNEQAKDKIRQAEASKLGIDTTGLTNDQVNDKIKQAREVKETEKLTKASAKLGVDITGLTNEQAKDKIMQAEASKLGIDITGLTNDQIKAKIKDAREVKKQEVTQKLTNQASKLGVDITGLTGEQARTKIIDAQAAKLGVDVTGLSNKDAREKIKEAHKQVKANKVAKTTNGTV